MDRAILCIDLKSFFASVECVERGLDPMTTDLVVADAERSDKTICLAVTPSMKAKGVRNRCRLFEIPKNMEYIIAVPRMQKYIDYAAEIYGIYIRYISPDDIHVYSIDEAFLDVTAYLERYKKTPKEMAVFLMNKVYEELGLRATAGVGTNLYLAKIALDITAKHASDFIGVLDEESYRQTLWDHKPLTDFWRVGHGISERLAGYGIFTMRQIAMADEDFMYKVFGVDAELMIDHAWGRETATIEDIHRYRSKTSSISSGQVLMRDYEFEEGKLIAKEMMELLCLDMVDKEIATSSITLFVIYSALHNEKPVHASASIEYSTSASFIWVPEVAKLYERIVNPNIPVRKLNISCNNVTYDDGMRQISLFDENGTEERIEKDRQVSKAVLDIKKKFGKNAMLKGMNLCESATTRERNGQIGGHKSNG